MYLSKATLADLFDDLVLGADLIALSGLLLTFSIATIVRGGTLHIFCSLVDDVILINDYVQSRPV